MMTEQEIVKEITELVAWNLVWVDDELNIVKENEADEFSGQYEAYTKVLGRKLTEQEQETFWKRFNSVRNNV